MNVSSAVLIAKNAILINQYNFVIFVTKDTFYIILNALNIVHLVILLRIILNAGVALVFACSVL